MHDQKQLKIVLSLKKGRFFLIWDKVKHKLFTHLSMAFDHCTLFPHFPSTKQKVKSVKEEKKRKEKKVPKRAPWGAGKRQRDLGFFLRRAPLGSLGRGSAGLHLPREVENPQLLHSLQVLFDPLVPQMLVP